MEWMDATITTLRTLWTEGHSALEIGRRMGRSKNAIVGKAHRLELEPRPSPILWDREPRVRVPRVPRAAATLPPLTSRQEPPMPVTDSLIDKVSIKVPPHAPGHIIRASVAARASHTPSPFDNVAYRPVRHEAPRLPIPTTKTCRVPYE